MDMIDIINKKKKGDFLSSDEIHFFVSHYTKGLIPDYQASALLMAICLKGMNPKETLALTQAMLESGKKADLSAISGIKVDKHSTGGVADTTTFIAIPIAAACGVKIAKMSGRGLGHTGGTLDKLGAIKGYNAFPTIEEWTTIVSKCNGALIGQTEDLAPADKKIYALRDASGTVDSLPLIASSIMSKKLAAGNDAILLDVKTGNGAFLHNLEETKALAQMMCEIGNQLGVQTEAIITDMSQPLGQAIGNSLELIEASQILQGEKPESRLTQVSLELAARMIHLAKICDSIESSRRLAKETLRSGLAFQKWEEMVKLCGGEVAPLKNPELFPKSRYTKTLLATRTGYLTHMETQQIGRCAMLLGAGRAKKEDPIDLYAGILLHCELGSFIRSGDPLATFYTEKEQSLNEVENLFRETLLFSEQRPATLPPLFY